jgi:hypothetical protein
MAVRVTVPPRGEQVEDHREAPTGAGGRSARTRGILGESKGLGAVGEERPVALGRVDGRTRVQDGQMGDELGRRLALPGRQRVDADEEIAIREGGRGSEGVDLHASSCITGFFALPAGHKEARGGPSEGQFSARDDFRPEVA